MEKFLKSLFNPGDKKRNSKGDGRGADEEDRNDFTPPLDGRRKLSISRSGRMKQNNKRRASLTKDLFGEDLHMQEKSTSKEYHVHGKAFSDNIQSQTAASSSKPEVKQNIARVKEKGVDVSGASNDVASNGCLTPEEEIENAFKIIDNNT